MNSFREEYLNCKKYFSKDLYIHIRPWNNDYSHLRVEIKGKEGNSYEGGVFGFEIKLNKKDIFPSYLRLSKEDLNSEKTVAEFKRDSLEKYNISPLTGLELIFKGKVLPDNMKIKEINFHPKKDILTVMVTIAGQPPWNKGYAYCFTLIWHPDIDSSIPPGSQNFRFNRNSDPNANLCKFIENLKKLIHKDPEIIELEYPLNKKAAEQYQKDPAKFNIKAKNWTHNYAQKEFSKD